MQTIRTSLQTDNHTSTPSLHFYRLDALPDAQPTVSEYWRQHRANCSSLYGIADRTCGDTFQVNSTCYKVHKNERVNWFTAFSRCRSKNATLAVFDDNILQYFPSSVLTDEAWIGLLKSRWTWSGAGQCSSFAAIKTDNIVIRTYVVVRTYRTYLKSSWLRRRFWGQGVETIYKYIRPEMDMGLIFWTQPNPLQSTFLTTHLNSIQHFPNLTQPKQAEQIQFNIIGEFYVSNT